MTCDFRTPGWLGRHPIAGVIMAVVGLLLFGGLAYELQTHGPMLSQDVLQASRLHDMAISTAATTEETLTFGFFLGKEITEIVGAILVIYFIYKRFWTELAMVVLGWSGGAGIWMILTSYFDRPRPEAQMGVVVHYPSFPSGHAMQAVLAFGMIAYFLVPRMPNLFWKWAMAIAGVLTIVFIGVSRLMQGGHYTSDVLAGYALGLAWAGIVYTLLERHALRRKV